MGGVALVRMLGFNSSLPTTDSCGQRDEVICCRWLWHGAMILDERERLAEDI